VKDAESGDDDNEALTSERGGESRKREWLVTMQEL